MAGDSNESSKSSLEHYASEGLILGAVSAMGYATAYLYERAFAEQIGIPARLVSVTIAGGGFVAFRMLTLSFFAAGVVRFLLTLTDSDHARRKGYRRIATVVAVAIVISFINNFSRPFVWVTLATVGVLVAIHFGVPALYSRKRGTYTARLEAMEASWGDGAHPFIPLEVFGPRVAPYVLVLSYFLWAAYSAARPMRRIKCSFP